MPKSKKPAIIEKLFEDRWDEQGGTLSSPVVTRAELREELRAVGMAASEGNINNFFKDFVRKATRNANWPKSIANRGYTARQGIKEGAVMVFEPIPADQTAPFPMLAPSDDTLANVRKIQSVSMDLTARRLGREDESWLTTVIDELRVVHQHLAENSTHGFAEVARLQTNVKLGGAEVDVLYLGVILETGGELVVLITCETKSRGEVLELEQVERGARAAQKWASRELNDPDIRVIATAVKVLDDGKLWVTEWTVPDVPQDHNVPEDEDEGEEIAVQLKLACEAVYELVPPVKGVAPARVLREAH